MQSLGDALAEAQRAGGSARARVRAAREQVEALRAARAEAERAAREVGGGEGDPRLGGLYDW